MISKGKFKALRKLIAKAAMLKRLEKDASIEAARLVRKLRGN